MSSLNVSAGNIMSTVNIPSFNAFTMICFAKIIADQADWNMVSIDNNSGGDGTAFFVLSRGSTGPSVTFFTGLGSAVGINLITIAQFQTSWYAFAMVGAGSTGIAYTQKLDLPGQLISVVSQASSNGAGTGMWFSNDGFADGNFPGLMCGMKLYNVALSPNEISLEFKTLTPHRWQDLIFSNPGNLDVNTPGIDPTGKANWTVNGTFTAVVDAPIIPLRNSAVASVL